MEFKKKYYKLDISVEWSLSYLFLTQIGHLPTETLANFIC